MMASFWNVVEMCADGQIPLYDLSASYNMPYVCIYTFSLGSVFGSPSPVYCGLPLFPYYYNGIYGVCIYRIQHQRIFATLRGWNTHTEGHLFRIKLSRTLHVFIDSKFYECRRCLLICRNKKRTYTLACDGSPGHILEDHRIVNCWLGFLLLLATYEGLQYNKFKGGFYMYVCFLLFPSCALYKVSPLDA